MLKVDDQEYLAKVKEFAAKIGKSESLQDKLDYLDHYADHEGNVRTRCLLFKDFAPYSFQFRMQIRNTPSSKYEDWFEGGLIFHGTHDNYGDGSSPTLYVCVSPIDGWSIHT